MARKWQNFDSNITVSSEFPDDILILPFKNTDILYSGKDNQEVETIKNLGLDMSSFSYPNQGVYYRIFSLSEENILLQFKPSQHGLDYGKYWHVISIY